MPLVRVEVRNEYGLGLPELYKEANKEDPKAILDGVAVAGLVGILRQLGDLAEVAAEIFHGLQEQVMTTASRSHKLIVRVQNIEAALPPLEKAVLAQTSHLHFCYTTGSDWHPRIQNERNHFIYNDLPRFITDSYEECRDPPRLHLLDKFDPGGPGSCLRRYSDPTFFKRVSAASDEANAKRSQRDKNTRKSKRKRARQRYEEVSRAASILSASGRCSWQRNGEVSRGASILSDSGRMQFATPHNYERSPAQTFSNVDMTFNSDLREQSRSFNSGTGSGYIECVFDLSSSMQPDELEPQESPPFLLNQENNDNLDCAYSDHSRVVDDHDFPSSSLKDQTGPSSSCVTWDEKAEIVESKGQNSYGDETPDMLPTDSCLDMQEPLGVNVRNLEQMDILLNAENTPHSIAEEDQHDDIESEPDNYVDALNTIESESENDFDCQTKREVQYSITENSEIGGMEETVADNLDHHLSDFESHAGSDDSSNKGMSCILPDPVSLENFPNEDSLHIGDVASNQDDLPGDNTFESNNILDGSKREDVIIDSSSSEFRVPNSLDLTFNEVINSIGKYQETPAKFSGVQSVQFWTNGGLLGLQPSKPPSCSVSNAVCQDSAIEKGPSLDCSMPGNANQEDAANIRQTSWGKSQANLGTKHDTRGNSYQSDRFDQTHVHDLDGASVSTSKIELTISPDVNDTSTDTNQENDQMFGIGHRLLVNGFRRKGSLVHDDRFGVASSLKTGAFQHKNEFHTVENNHSPAKSFKEQFENGSSPPLEHMKISFQPMTGFESSKLKLKFPDGNHCEDFNRDMFPSFQLVPEPAIQPHGIGSDSDDDTFCRSSPYVSDDCPSCQSESNSEQWESSETPESKNNELYDALCRVSCMDPVSGSLELDGKTQGSIHIDSGLSSPYENGVEHSLCGPMLDFPSFDALEPSLQRHMILKSDPNVSLVSQVQKQPMPPPLPPVQWRVLKSHSDVIEGKQNFVLEALGHAFDMKDMQAALLLEQPKPALTKQQEHVVEAALSIPESKHLDLQKLNGQKEAIAANDKGMDEREDFLQQIRTKSFNLRRTGTAKPTITPPAPTTSVKVTAILEKANAIRQAVGSDDGEEDDTWSDA